MIGLCRLCASLKKPNLLITIKEQSDKICEKLQKCCQLQLYIKDNLPKSICQECLECLDVSYKFYIKVQEAQETLEALFPNSTDISPNDSDKGRESMKGRLSQSATTPPKAEERKAKCIKKSPHNVGGTKIKIEKDVSRKSEPGHNSQNSNAFTISNVASIADDTENDGYLREVYSILGMGKCDVNIEALTQKENNNIIVFEENMDNEDNLREQAQRESEHVDEYYEDDQELDNHITTGDDFDEVVLMGNEMAEEIEIQEDEDNIAADENGNGHEINNQDIDKNFSTLPPELQISNWTSYTYLCYVCDYKAPDFKDLAEHARTKHSVDDVNKLQFKCYDCQRVIVHYNTFLNHIRLNHHPALKLRCDACDKLCDESQQYENHRNIECLEANNFPNYLPCWKCCRSFHSAYGLQTHVKRMHTTQMRKETFKCTLCNKEFSHKRSLKNHNMIHEQQKNFACEFCDKLFMSKGNLEVHRCTHISENVYKCNICQKSFKSDVILRKHQLIHTENAKPFKCSFCAKEFRTKIEKTSHERVHTGEMPLQCSHCEKRFRFRSALNAHLKVHSGIKEHECKFCPKKFIDISNFKKHIRRKHYDADNAAKREQ